MRSKHIVIGQKVDPVKVQRARELRRRLTPEEKVLWQALRANRLEGMHFRRQQVIDGFIVDFYCHAAGLVVELDGEVHLLRPGYDEARDAILAGRDLKVLRFPNEEIRRDLKGSAEANCIGMPAADLTPRPPSLKGKEERHSPLPVSGRGRG